MSIYTPETDVFEVHWEGPFTYEEFGAQFDNIESEENGLKKDAWVLYALYDDHPLYGKDVLYYIGKSKKIQERLKNHFDDWWGGKKCYIASVYEFENWKSSDESADYEGALKPEKIKNSKKVWTNEGNDLQISCIEELLIYGLTPAGNIRNKGSAKNSRNYRIFNTGSLGSLPSEVSGGYMLEHSINLVENGEE